MAPKVSIIILNWNGLEYLQNCLGSIFDQKYDNFDTILVDNDSKDNSIEFVKKKFQSVDIHALNKNYGVPKGFNIGIKYALKKYHPDYMLFLNTDTKMVQKNFLENLISFAERNNKVGILGCKIIFPDGKTQHLGAIIGKLRWTYVKNLSPKEPCAVDSIMGAMFLIKRAVIDKIGLFDEGFSPFLYEETDYCIRAKKSGFSINVIPQLEIIHFWSGSMKKFPSKQYRLALYKNSIRLKLLNDPLQLLFPRLLLNFLGCLMQYDEKRLLKIKIKRRFIENIMIFLEAMKINLHNLPEIIRKRNHRDIKIWH